MPTMRDFCASAFILSVGLSAGCGSAEPFHYVKVCGRVAYEDGSPIPADILRVTFIPQASAADSKTHPLAGTARVGADGVFDSVTSHKPGDGLVPGKHKVTVVALDGQERPTAAVHADYADSDRTPLEVDTANRPFTLLVKKPR